MCGAMYGELRRTSTRRGEHPRIFAVIPAKAGIHLLFRLAYANGKSKWIPAFAGMTMRQGPHSASSG